MVMVVVVVVVGMVSESGSRVVKTDAGVGRVGNDV